MIFLNTLNHQYTGGQDRQIATSPKACSLNYMVSSRLAWATDVRLCLKKKKKMHIALNTSAFLYIFIEATLFR